MLTKEDIAKIRELYYEKGYSQNRIAKETGFNRATIKKYLSDEIEGGKRDKAKLNKREEEEEIESEIREIKEAEQKGKTICIDVGREAFLIALSEVLDTLLFEDLSEDVRIFMIKLAQYRGELSPEDFYAQLLLNNVDEKKSYQAALLYNKCLERVEEEGVGFIIEKEYKEGRFKCLNRNYH